MINISKNKTQCQFCMEFTGNPDAFYNLLLPHVPTNRTIISYGGFRVLPPLGQFVEGAVMIVSKQHYISCAKLPKKLYYHLESIMKIVESMLTDKYRIPIFFEHGPNYQNIKGICCVDHAHIHAFPVKVDVHSILKKKYPYEKIGKMSELNSLKTGNGGYIFLQQADNRYFYPLDKVESQFVRKIIADELDMPEKGDWKNYMGLNEFNKTYNKLITRES